MMHVNEVTGHDRVVVAGSEKGGRNRALQLDQKCLSWMMVLLAKLSKGGQLLVYPRLGMFEVAKACMILQKHWRLVESEIDVVCFYSSLTAVGQTFSWQLMNEDLDIKRSQRWWLQCRRRCLP